MKYWRAYLHFYKSQFAAGLILFLLCWFYLSLPWAILFYMLLGSWSGFLAFRFFYKNQLTFYHNLGITNWRLIKVVSLINIITILVVAALVAGFYTLFL